MLKRFILIIFIGIVIAIATGYFFKSRGDDLTGDRIIGMAVLALTFIVMPLFIFYRYRKTSINKYLFPGKREENEEDPAGDQ